jgi:hypothetical protein
MRDSHTGERIVVKDYGQAAPSVFTVREEQLSKVEKILRAHEVEFWPDGFTISIDDEPPVVRVHISRNSDPKLVQTLLDELP